MAFHAIRYDPACDEAADKLGGYGAIDDSLTPYLEWPTPQSEGVLGVEAFWGSVRCVKTIAIGDMPTLLWYFVIEANGDVLITHVEKYDDAIDH